MKHCLLVFAAVVALAIGVPASAQYMYLDVNGDGACTSADALTPTVTSVDVYLKTNQYANGTTAVCNDNSGTQMTINSYTFILSAPTGGVTYGAWTDNMGFTINANPFPDGRGVAGNDIWIAKASGVIQGPGSYKLGTLAVTVSAPTRLEFRQASSIDGTAMTSFGTQCPGNDFDNTYKYDPNYAIGSPGTGDWKDVCGTAVGTPVTETTWGKIKANYSH
jgi:hypothetical protein